MLPISPFGEGHLRGHGNLALAPLDGDHTTTKGAGFSVHLNTLLKKLLLETTHTHSNLHITQSCNDLAKHTHIL